MPTERDAKTSGAGERSLAQSCGQAVNQSFGGAGDGLRSVGSDVSHAVQGTVQSAVSLFGGLFG
jgi:hypothetical protein